MSKPNKVLLQLRQKINAFYLLALVPLLIFAYFHTGWLFSIIIPLYGYILLIIKKDNLTLYKQPKRTQSALGLMALAGSFLVYYALALFLPSITFYNAANYIVYLIGLCLIFFEMSALKEIASPIFLVAAGASSPFISDWIGTYLSPHVTVQFAYLINGILNLLGVKSAIVQSSSDASPYIRFPTIQGGQITALFNWYCVGATSLIIFSIILVILLIEEHSNVKSRILWSIVGIAGILILNVFRVVVILMADYFYGSEVGGTVHYVIGYSLFITWLTVFLYAFSRKASSSYSPSIEESVS